MSVKHIASFILLAATAAVARPTQHFRRGDVSISEWHSHNLESYWTFRNRFHALNCGAQRGSPFYESCCYPLGADESLSSRPDNCTPKDATCDIVPASPAPSTSVDDGSVDNGHSEDPSAPESSQPDDNDENLPWCDDEGDDDDYDDGDNQDQNATEAPAPASTPEPQPDNSGDNNNDNGDNNQDNSGSGNNQVFSSGQATWYEQEGLAGACGDYYPDSAYIAAMDFRKYGNIDSVSPLCGKSVHIKNLRNGNTVEVVIRDVCPSCLNEDSIDLSLAAFAALDDMNVGVLPIEWYFMN